MNRGLLSLRLAFRELGRGGTAALAGALFYLAAPLFVVLATDPRAPTPLSAGTLGAALTAVLLGAALCRWNLFLEIRAPSRPAFRLGRWIASLPAFAIAGGVLAALGGVGWFEGTAWLLLLGAIAALALTTPARFPRIALWTLGSAVVLALEALQFVRVMLDRPATVDPTRDSPWLPLVAAAAFVALHAGRRRPGRAAPGGPPPAAPPRPRRSPPPLRPDVAGGGLRGARTVSVQAAFRGVGGALRHGFPLLVYPLATALFVWLDSPVPALLLLFVDLTRLGSGRGFLPGPAVGTRIWLLGVPLSAQLRHRVQEAFFFALVPSMAVALTLTGLRIGGAPRVTTLFVVLTVLLVRTALVVVAWRYPLVPWLAGLALFLVPAPDPIEPWLVASSVAALGLLGWNFLGSREPEFLEAARSRNERGISC